MQRKHSVLLSLLFVAASASSSSAYRSNCQAELSSPGERHYFGGYKSVTSIWGASATIETQNVDLCTATPVAGTNLSAMWVGIDNASTNLSWIQMGYRRLSSYTSNHIYQEANSASTNQYFIWDKAVPTGTNNYKVDLYWAGSNASSSWNFYLNGVLQTNSIPFNDLNITPVVIQVQDEVKNPGNQIAGTVSNPVSWSDVASKSTKTGAYSATQLPKGAIDPATPNVGQNMSNPDTAWEIWDTRYP